MVCKLLLNDAVMRKMISVALLQSPGLGLALSQYKQWQSFIVLTTS